MSRMANRIRRPRDIDESILQHAVELLSLVRTDSFSMNVDILEDIPQVLVYLYEKIASEPIPPESKQFNNMDEKAYTLQTLLNTLEQSLGISLNHLSGRGLATLNRRQLADALGIFDDLVRHSLVETDLRQADTPDSSLPLSVLDLLETSQDDDQFITPKLASKQVSLTNNTGGHGHVLRRCDSKSSELPVKEAKRNEHRSLQHVDGPVRVTSSLKEHDAYRVPVADRYVNGRQRMEQSTRPEPSRIITESSTTKKMYTKRSQPRDGSIDQERNKNVALRPVANPTISLCPKTHTNPPIDKDVPVEPQRVWGVHDDRYVPYRKDRMVAKRGNAGTPVLVRKPSVKSFRNDKNSTQPSVYFEHKSKQVKSVRNNNIDGQKDNERKIIRHPSLTAKTRGTDEIDCRSVNKRKSSFRSGRHSSNVAIDKEQSRVKRSSVSDRKASVRSVRSRQPSVRTGHVQDQPDTRPPVSGRSRVPSVVSTKVRKHSERSPKGGDYVYSTVKRGRISPQTTSLCSSLKFLEEFDYINRRLEEIRHLKQEHVNAINDLEHEAVRLEAVLSHVHRKSRHTNFRVNQHEIGSRQ